MEGFFKMKEGNHSLDQVLMASAPMENYDKGTAEKMLSSCTWRITVEDGVHSCEEWLGTGENLTYQFELGKEFLFISSERGHYATGVVTGDGKGSFIMISKDKKSGVVSEFKFNVDENGLTGVWSIPGTQESCELGYQRVGDCQGGWNLVSREGISVLWDALGLTAVEKVQMDGMFKSYTLMQTGGDVWAFKGDIDIDTPLVFGEEFSYDMIGKKCTELVTHTREGYVSALKMGKNVILTKMKCGKQFQIAELSVDGCPNSNVTMIYVRA
eukprot:TRINITY_DN11561_c0_g1_i3.p1 TRINITY_DN11561_c0_g1~~TRINITY_DN11561_c0_g1_i3.p1  ORF type:complete len:280 (+),score=58.55 TRINITY_DN11561_c0_g1_i3:31-840(+)